MYFFYIPLAFLIAEQFRREDLERIMRMTLWLAIAAAPLVLLQFFSPPDSIVNQGSGLDEETQFKAFSAALGRVRPNRFLYRCQRARHVCYQRGGVRRRFADAGTAFAGCQPKDAVGRHLPLYCSCSSSAAAAGCSRMSLLFSPRPPSPACSHGARASQSRPASGRFSWLPLARVLWPILMPEGFEVFMARWEGAWESETQSTGLRVRHLQSGLSRVLRLSAITSPDTPIQGYLLGIGGNAAKQLAWVQLPPAYYAWDLYGAWAEDAWSRHIVDLGLVLGLVTILGRIALTAWLGLVAARATRRSGDVLPFVLFGFLFFPILNGQIQGQGTLNGYAWMFFGFCLAATKIANTVPRQPPAFAASCERGLGVSRARKPQYHRHQLLGA